MQCVVRPSNNILFVYRVSVCVYYVRVVVIEKAFNKNRMRKNIYLKKKKKKHNRGDKKQLLICGLCIWKKMLFIIFCFLFFGFLHSEWKIIILHLPIAKNECWMLLVYFLFFHFSLSWDFIKFESLILFFFTL